MNRLVDPLNILNATRPVGIIGLALMSLGLTPGCNGEAGSPSSRVVQPRILALQAEPPVIGFGQDTAITPLIAGVDNATVVDLTFRACNPWRAISDPTADCGPQESLPLAADTFPGGDGAWLRTIDVLSAFPPPDWYQPGGPSPIVVGAPGGMGGGEPECGTAYESIDVVVVIEALIQPAEGASELRLVATKRVRVTAEPVLRQNPVIESLTLDEELSPDTFVPGQQYTVFAAPRQDSLDLLCNEDGLGVLEGVEVYLYASAGQLEDPAIDVEYSPEGQETAGSTLWTAPDQGDATLWLVAIDGEGGIGWHRVDLASQ